MKNTISLFTMLLLVVAFSFSCEKENFDPTTLADTPAMEVKKESCFSPEHMTLFLAHPEDFYYYSNTDNYQVDWSKEGKFIHSGYRLDCTSAGNYLIEINFLETGAKYQLTYELNLGDQD